MPLLLPSSFANKRRKVAAVACLGILACGTLFAGADAKITVTTDHTDAIYKTGEPIRFTVKLLPGSNETIPEELEIDWLTTRDGSAPKQQGKVTLKNGTGEIAGQLDQPGFLQCKVTAALGNRKLEALGGAAVAPLKITSKQVMPEDFDAFWNGKKAELAKVPMEPKLTSVPSEKQGVEAFDLQVKALGSIPVSAYFARPEKAQPKSLPAIVSVHGAGVTSSMLPNAVSWAEKGMLSIDMNAHGLPNGRDKEFYAALRADQYKGYPHWGRFSRDESYFLGMFLRIVRAIDFLTSQPEWDGRTVIVRGNSQGGAQAIAAAGIDERVTFFAAGVPAMAEHNGILTGDPTGWPKMIPVDADGKPNAKVAETARYFDAVNFMRKTKADGFFVIAFLDTTCAPTTGYAAYNALTTRKSVYNDIAVGHENTKEAGQKGRAAILRHASKNK